MIEQRDLVWAAVYAAAYMQFGTYRTPETWSCPPGFGGPGYQSDVSHEMCCELACDLADRATKELLKRQSNIQ